MQRRDDFSRDLPATRGDGARLGRYFRADALPTCPFVGPQIGPARIGGSVAGGLRFDPRQRERRHLHLRRLRQLARDAIAHARVERVEHAWLVAVDALVERAAREILACIDDRLLDRRTRFEDLRQMLVGALSCVRGDEHRNARGNMPRNRQPAFARFIDNRAPVRDWNVRKHFDEIRVRVRREIDTLRRLVRRAAVYDDAGRKNARRDERAVGERCAPCVHGRDVVGHRRHLAHGGHAVGDVERKRPRIRWTLRRVVEEMDVRVDEARNQETPASVDARRPVGNHGPRSDRGDASVRYDDRLRRARAADSTSTIATFSIARSGRSAARASAAPRHAPIARNAAARFMGMVRSRISRPRDAPSARPKYPSHPARRGCAPQALV